MGTSLKGTSKALHAARDILQGSDVMLGTPRDQSMLESLLKTAGFRKIG